MRRSLPATVARFVFLALVATPVVRARSAADGDGIQWETDFAAALEKAKKEGKPILAAFNMDNEPACQEAFEQDYPDPKVVTLSRKMVCLIGSIGEHAPAGAPCTRFPSITCEDHKRVEKQIRKAYLTSDLVIAPQHIFAGPSGEELFRRVYQIPRDELKKCMALAIAGKTGEPAGADAEVSEVWTAEKTRVDQLLKDVESGSADVRDPALRALATANDPRALPAVLAKAKPGNPDMTRFAAVFALGVKGNYAAVKPLVAMLAERDTKLSIFALNALMKIELPDPIPDILKLLAREKSDRIRAYALRAAAACHPGSPEVQKVCLQAFRGASGFLEQHALKAAFLLKPDAKVVAAVKPLLAAKTLETRSMAVWVLGKQRDPALVPLLEKIATEDKAVEVRETAPKAAAYCKGEEVPGYEAIGSRFCWDEDLAEITWSSSAMPREAGSPPRVRR